MNAKKRVDSREFNKAVRAIIERDIFTGARFGIAAHDIGDGCAIYELNAHQIFPAASTTKIPTSACALALLGTHFRFRTRIVRQGTIDDSGTLHGDIILVASGDPNLSGRVTPHDTLEFHDLDHGYAGAKARLVERNPLQIIEMFARGVRDAGIRRVTGTVLVDIHLFAEAHGEPGTVNTMISPVAVNDNQIDMEFTAGTQVGAPVSYRLSPNCGYVRFINRAATGTSDCDPTLRFSREQCELDGTRSVVITGTLPAGKKSMAAIEVEKPSRFARTLLVEALAAAGVVVEGGLFGSDVTAQATPTDAEVLAEHVSPPLVEATKIVLKVSQNLHAEMLIPLIGATLRGAHGIDAVSAGYECCAGLLARWGIDTTDAFQADACGANGYFSPDFMCRLLVRIAASDVHDALVLGLPIMGRDGTLWDIQPESPAAGHVAAKTGTICFDNRLQKTVLFTCKGLAGYVTSKRGRRIAFTIYVNNFHCARSLDADPGQALGELAAAIYEHL
jgi:D-alanyl-D-alanine carboxypeptidase/D-alanyl-D-alanine-endopeptidase (penicillin-binding protein 4)